MRDFAQVKGNGKIDTEIARYALEALNIDRHGLDEIDNKILNTIIDKFKGGPVGVSTIATAIGEDTGTVEEVYEPFLILRCLTVLQNVVRFKTAVLVKLYIKS